MSAVGLGCFYAARVITGNTTGECLRVPWDARIARCQIKRVHVSFYDTRPLPRLPDHCEVGSAFHRLYLAQDRLGFFTKWFFVTTFPAPNGSACDPDHNSPSRSHLSKEHAAATYHANICISRVARDSRDLEHFPAALNQGDSQLPLPRRIWRN